MIDSKPFPKLLIDDLGLYWQLSPERFTKSSTAPNTFNYQFAKGNFSITLKAEDFNLLEKLLNSDNEMMNLEEKMTELNFTTELFSGKGNLDKPSKK